MGQPEAQERKIEKERKVASATVENAPKEFASENADDELCKVSKLSGDEFLPAEPERQDGEVVDDEGGDGRKRSLRRTGR